MPNHNQTKKLNLSRETVKNLKVKTQVKAGGPIGPTGAATATLGCVSMYNC